MYNQEFNQETKYHLMYIIICKTNQRLNIHIIKRWVSKRPNNILQIIICNFIDCMFIITNNYNLWIITNTN
jgi:hypothetical protein